MEQTLQIAFTFYEVSTQLVKDPTIVPGQNNPTLYAFIDLWHLRLGVKDVPVSVHLHPV